VSPVYSGGVDVAPADEDISTLSTTMGQQLASSAADAWDESPTSKLMRLNEMSAANGIVPDMGGQPIPPELAKMFADQPKISQDDAKAKVKAAGFDGEISVPDRPQVNEAAIDLMIDHAKTERERAATIADGPKGFISGALDFGTGFLVGAADPLNIAATMIPVVGEAHYAKLLAGGGESILARAAIRAGTGAAQGAAFSAAFLPVDWAADTSDGRDFTLSQALRSIIAGAGQFGVMHAGGGLMSDLLRTIGPSSARRPLYPFAPGEPLERKPIEPAAAAPGAPGAETTAAPGAPAGGVQEAPAPGTPEAVRAAASRSIPQGLAAGAEGSTRALDEVLANPRVGEPFANLRIERDHDVRYGAGADAEDPNVVHVDKRVPHEDTINGVTYDPAIPVALHELDEKDGMEHDGLAYAAAHRMRGEPAEKAWVDANLGPGAWPIYTRRWDGWLSHIEGEEMLDPPEGLYTKPYPEKERELIARRQRNETTNAGERRTIANEVSTGVARAGRPQEEAKAAGELFAARYATRAARFGGRAGSALDMYREEHLGIRRGDKDFTLGGRAYEQPGAGAPDLFAEREAEGQQNLPGTERIGQGELAQRRAYQPLKPTKEQKPMDVGLFGDEAKQKTLFQDEHVPSWYYSGVGRAIEGAKQDKASPQQWLGMLKNAAGVKGEELEWLGLEDWLKAHKGQVTKQEIADYVRANQIELHEVEKGGAGIGEDDVERMALQQPDDFTKRLTDAGISLSTALSYRRSVQLGYEASIREVAAILREANPAATKFNQYSLPGGENYRELLLTLPERGDASAKDANGHPYNAESFHGSHWDEPNVLAHVRFDDREIDGKKVLHLAEIQSDWHQRGRKQGYDQEKLPNRYQLLDAAGSSHGVYDTPEAAEAMRQQLHGQTYPGDREPNDTTSWRVNPVEVRSGVGVPDAPFKTTWPELALKRMIRYAAENGYDRLSWDTGATNAERYDLSKQISRIEFERSGTSGFTRLEDIERAYEGIAQRGTVKAYDHSGKEVISQHVEDAELPDIIGKEAADKILQQKPNRIVRSGTAVSTRQLSGLDLKVGGEGMRGFYDKILPATANKLTKRFGAAVERSELSAPGDKYEIHSIAVDPKTGRVLPENHVGPWREAYAVFDRRSGKLEDGHFPTMELAQEHWDELSAEPVAIHSVDITPQLREAATSQGFPLFQGGPGGPRGRITMRPNRAIIDLFKSADSSTFLHEAGHLWLEELAGDADHDEAPQQIRDDFSTVLKWLGVDRSADIGKDQHEQWARGFEQYLMEGRAPSKGLAAVFEKFREWISAVYRAVTELRTPMNDEIRGVMDRMLASDQDIAGMQGALRDLPDPAKEDLLRATIGSMADGKGSPASQMLDAAAGKHPAIARTAAAVGGAVKGQEGGTPNLAATDDAEAFRAIAERKAPQDEEAAIAAFKAAEKLPEPPSADAEPPRTTSLAAARRAAAEGQAVDVAVRAGAARGPRARPQTTWSLMEFLASRGGIDPNDKNIGDVKAILGRGNKFIPGFGHLVRKGGMPLDRAREASVEASYLRDNRQTGESEGLATTTVRDLLDALDDEARGHRRYREGVAPPGAEADPAEIERDRDQQAALRAELDTALREVQIDPDQEKPELLARTIEIMNREGESDPVLAYERAAMERHVDEAEAGQFEPQSEAIPGWDKLDDAGAASPAGGGAAGAARGESAGSGGAARAAGEGARDPRGESLDQDAVTPLARAAVEADARSAQNFAIETADLPEPERARVNSAIALIDHEAANTADTIRTAASALGTGINPAGAIARTAETLGAQVTRETIESEVKALDGAIKVFEQEGLSKGEAAQRATDERLDKNAERAAIARRTAREHSMAIIREVRRLNDLHGAKVPIRDALEAITGGVNTPFYRSRDSIEAVWHVLHDKYVGERGVDGALRREGLSKLAYSQSIDDEIEREMYELDRGEKGKPGVTKNKQALRIAQIFHAADKQSVADHNLSGGWVRTLSGHATKQQWNPEAIRAASQGGNGRRIVDELQPGKVGQEADRLAFLKDFLDNLDLRRTFGRMPQQAIRDALYELWVPLKNGDHFDFQTPSDDPVYPNVPAKAASHREFFFKSADAARTMRKKYGLYPSFIESKYRGYENLSRQTALIGRLGPKPEEAIREIRDRALEMTKATNERQAVEKFVNGRGGAYDLSTLDKQMGFLTGKANKPLYSLGARIAAGWMVWERMSMLGRVLLTHIEGLTTKSSELRYWGASAIDRYKGFFTDMRRAAPDSERGRLMELIWSGHDADNSFRAARYDTADTAPGILARLSDVYFRLTGVTHVLPNQRQGAQHVMARELAMERGKAFGDVDPKIQRILSLYGIAEPEWKLLHGTEWTRGRTPDGAGPGGSSADAFLTPEDALKLSDDSMKAYLKTKPNMSGAFGMTDERIARAKNDLATQLATMYSDRGLYAMFGGASVRTKARIFGATQPGTVGGVAVRLLMQFKQWPVEMMYRTWGREIYGGNKGMGRVGSILELVAMSTVMGTLGELVRDSLKGENPFPRFAAHPVDYLMHGLMRSGIGSIAGDYLFGEFDRHLRSVLESAVGPTLGQVNDVADLYYGGGDQEKHPWGQRAADLVRLVKTNGGPLVNFWATSWAFEYLVMFRLQEWMHPGYVERYQRKMEQERGVHFIVSPTAAIGR
jgi:hypothetical protein